MVGDLSPAAQAGVDFGPLLDGTVSSTLFYRMLGYASAAGSRVGASDGRTVTRYADGYGSV